LWRDASPRQFPTEFDLDSAFKSYFGKSKTPDISGIAMLLIAAAALPPPAALEVSTPNAIDSGRD
jgi:hypothetical protein